PVLLLALLPLPDGRRHPTRARVPAAQARDRELSRLPRARGRRTLALAADGVAGARDRARCELRSRAADVGPRDADRERGALAVGGAHARALARGAREPHALSSRFRGPHGGPRQAVEGVAPPLLAPVGDLSAAPHHARSPRRALPHRGLAANVGAGRGAVPRLLVHRRRFDARAARPGRYRPRSTQLVS